MFCCSVTVQCEQCYSVIVNSNRRLHLEAAVHHTQYKSSELTYHWELFVVAGANSYIPRCTYLLIVFNKLIYITLHTSLVSTGRIIRTADITMQWVQNVKAFL